MTDEETETKAPGDLDLDLAEGRSGAIALEIPASASEGGPKHAKRPWRFRPRRKSGSRSKLRWVFEWAIVLVSALVLALILRTFAFQVFYVPSPSMVPTLDVGDRIIVDKFLFNYHSLKEGDIVVFSKPPLDTMCGPAESDLVKRVIGLPGQTISEDRATGQVLINGKVLSEPYLPKDDPLGSAVIRTEKIPEDQYFMLGDNRSVSCDSRYWGTISGSTMVGRVVAVIWRNGHPALVRF